ncbi:MAG: hypothetical protein ACTSR3_14765 [Candidatus Helarchaeota archaeon]
MNSLKLKNKKSYLVLFLIILFIVPIAFQILLDLQTKNNKSSIFSNLANSMLSTPVDDSFIIQESADSEVVNGNGNLLNTILTLNISNQFIDRNVNSDFSIDTNGWNITKTNLIFSSVFTEITNDVETTTSTSGVERLDQLIAMEFNMSSDGYLQKINVSLRANTLLSAPKKEIKVIIFNKTTSGKPGYYFYQEEIALHDYISVGYEGWIEIPLAKEVFLEYNNTYDGKFFVVLGEQRYTGVKPNTDWLYKDDDPDPDDGAVYHNNNGLDPDDTNWVLVDRDYLLSVKVATSVKPSDVELAVNGTNIQDLQIGSGKWSSSELYLGSNVYFNITGQPSTTFNINYTCQFRNETVSSSNFTANSHNSVVNWNAIVGKIFFHDSSYSKKINVSIPYSWNVTRVFDENKSDLIWINQTSYPLKFVLFNVTTNGSWIIDCNGTNFAGDIWVFNNSGKVRADTYYLNDTIIINATINVNSQVKANLTIFDPDNSSVYTDLANIVNNVASFSPWQIIQNSTKCGKHYIQVSWNNGSHASVNMTTIMCLNETTNLSKISGPDPGIVLKGDPITAQIFYNDTYDDQGIAGAIIKSNWTLPSMSVIDWDNGTYNLTFQTSFASNRSYAVNVIAMKDGYDVAWIIIRFNVTTEIIEEPTELKIIGSIPYTEEDIYVNDTGKFVILNYTVKSNGTGITGDTIMTNPDWGTYYFQAEDLSITNSSQKGLYKVWLDTTGTHAYEQHNILFSAAKYLYESSEITSPNFQIDPIPAIIDVSGYENITKFEGEIVDFYTYYKDNYHAGNPPILNAAVNWTLNTTPSLRDDLDLKIVIYEGLINLPELGVEPGTYNITIKAQAPDYEGITINLTLNVLPKWNTTIWITNHTNSEIRVGKDIKIVAKIEFENESLNHNEIQLQLDIVYSNGFNIHEIKLTNSSGIITYSDNSIPEITWINVSVSYDGTAQIKGNSTQVQFLILSKYDINLTIHDQGLNSYLFSGELYSINTTIFYNNSGTWSALIGVQIDFTLEYQNIEEDILSLTSDYQGMVTLQFTPPEGAGSVTIRARYSGNASFCSAQDNTFSLDISKHNLTIVLFDFNPLEILVSSPLFLYCKVLGGESGLPCANVTVSFFLFAGNPNMKLLESYAITNEEGIASTALILFDFYEFLPFLSIGVEFSGDENTAQSLTTSSIPIIPMTTTKYIMKYVNEYLWAIIIALGLIATVSIYKTRKYLLNRGWHKKINHLIVLTESGLPISSWKLGGGPLDTALISGAISGISGIVREMTKSAKKLSSIDHGDKKVLFHYSKLVNGVMITDKDQPIMHDKLKQFVENFESKYYYYLTPFDGNLDYFTDADDLLVDIFPFAIPETYQEKMKLIPDIIKKERRLREINIQAGNYLRENKIAMAANLYKEAAKIAIDVQDVEEFEKFIKNIENIKKRLSKFSLKSIELDPETKKKITQKIQNNLKKSKDALRSFDYSTAIKLTTENAKLYLDLNQIDIILELFSKIQEYSLEHRKKTIELKEKEKNQKIKNKIQKIKMKALKFAREEEFNKAADLFNEAALLALQIQDKNAFENFMSKVSEYQKKDQKRLIKKEKNKQKEILESSLNRVLAEIETAKLAEQYEKCVQLYLRAANICQKLGDEEKFLEYSMAAKDFRNKLEETRQK